MRLLLLLIAIITITIATGCNKKHCWGCRVVFYDSFTTQYNDTYICDKTNNEIAEMRRVSYDARDRGFLFYKLEQCGKN